MNFEYEIVTKDNLEDILALQHKIFPKPQDDARWCYTKCAEGDPRYCYYAVKQNGKRIGITGLYYLIGDHSSAWLGWFGVLRHYRRNGVGSKIIQDYLAEARRRGFTIARLYTGAKRNKVALSFYRSCGFVEEQFKINNASMPLGYNESITIFSTSLTDAPVELWNNRRMDFL